MSEVMVETRDAAGDAGRPLGWAMATLAVAVPTLLAYNKPPSATFLNQALSLVGWSGWLIVLAAGLPAQRRGLAGAGPLALLAALALLALAALAAPWWTGLPTTLALSSAGLIAAAALAVMVAVRLQRAGQAQAPFEAFCVALAVAGLLGSVIGALQVFAPEWTGGDWIAPSAAAERAVGNLRQPNHLSSLVLWSMIAVVWLGDAGRLPRAAMLGLLLAMLFGVVLSASRTGMLGTLVLALWGSVDRTLSRRTRLTLMLLPLVYVVFWAGVGEWARLNEQVFAGETQLHKSDISSSRFGIWKNTLALIAAHPWTGVGFGEFNFAWSLTPFPGRPTAFFDHTHNMLLQFAVELGLPLATLIVALSCWALFEAIRQASPPGQAERLTQRAALVMVLMIALHSQLEYPLWYAYFLLPAAFAFGVCVAGPPRPADAADGAGTGPARRRPLMIGGLLMLLGSLGTVLDYQRVVVIFSPGDGAAPLAQRIVAGRGSVFFGHHADYAAATIAEHPSQVLPAFERATHYLLDTRLMMAWATALHEIGDDERARHLAQRLREFRNEQADEFFAPCKAPPEAGREPPFQCRAPTKALDYRDFR